MPKKRPSAKRGKRQEPAAKRARRSHRVRRLIRPDWLLLALLALSLAIRLWGIQDRLPDGSLGINVLDDSAVEETDRTTMGRAWAMWRGGTKDLDLNPHTGGWPALSFYITLMLQYLYKIWFSLSQTGATAAEYQKYVAGTGSAPLFLFARLAGALIGVATVYLTYRIGARYLGRPVGLLGGLLLGTNVLHVLTSQHVSDPNLLALLFTLLATEPLLRVEAGGGMRDSIVAGVMIGLAGACKYVPLALAAPLAIAHRMSERGRRIPLLRNREVWAGILATFVTIFVASPFLFLDWKATLRDLAGQRRALFSDWVGQTVFPISLPTYLTSTLPHAMGWPAYLLGLVGMVLLWRGGKAARTLVFIPAVMLLANGMLKSPQERYVMLALPYLELGAALTLVRGYEWVRAQTRARTEEPIAAPRESSTTLARGAMALLAAFAVAWPMPELVRTRHALALPDSRHLARRWINEHIPTTSPTAIELYGPVFTQRERSIVIMPFFATQSQYARPAFHREFLDGLEYHVASGEISRRFEADSAKYPVEIAYYRWLREHGTVVWESDVVKNAGPHIIIRRLPSHISTRAERDSVWRLAMPKPTQANRIELWCLDLSKVFLQLDQTDRSEEWARRGLYVNVTSMEAQVRATLALALWREGRLEVAESEAAQAVRLAAKAREKNPGFYLYHGAILVELKRYDEALKEYRESYALTGDPRILLSIAQALERQGRYDDAVNELLRFPTEHPDRAVALRNAAVLLLEHTDRGGEALNLLRESIRLSPNQEQAELVRNQIARLEAIERKLMPQTPARR